MKNENHMLITARGWISSTIDENGASPISKGDSMVIQYDWNLMGIWWDMLYLGYIININQPFDIWIWKLNNAEILRITNPPLWIFGCHIFSWAAAKMQSQRCKEDCLMAGWVAKNEKHTEKWGSYLEQLGMSWDFDEKNMEEPLAKRTTQGRKVGLWIFADFLCRYVH